MNKLQTLGMLKFRESSMCGTGRSMISEPGGPKYKLSGSYIQMILIYNIFVYLCMHIEMNIYIYSRIYKNLCISLFRCLFEQLHHCKLCQFLLSASTQYKCRLHAARWVHGQCKTLRPKYKF